MDLPDLNLEKKLGPLPLGTWLVVGGAGVAVAYYLSGRTAAADLAAADAGTVSPSMYDPLAGAGGGAGYVGTGVDAITPMSSPDDSPVSNAQWLPKAAHALSILSRPWTPSQIQDALQRYLDGRTLSTTQRQIVDDAIRQAGYPPEGVLPGPDPVPPAPAPGTTGTTGYERIPPQLVPKAKLGHRQTRVGRRPNGHTETAQDIARRVYSSMIFANYIDFFNHQLVASRGGVTGQLPEGALIAY